jgi:hypothetical protein
MKKPSGIYAGRSSPPGACPEPVLRGDGLWNGKNVYLFTPKEGERDLIVQALCAFAAASPPNGSS